jgi:hypothetical protein
MMNPWLIPLSFLVGAVAVLAAAAAVRSARAAHRRRRRVVEAPNSHHTWQRVRERETHEHWRSVDLDRIHPVNREEVVRLLARIEAGGADFLRPQERRFLDQMAEIAGSGPPRPAPAAQSTTEKGPPPPPRQSGPSPASVRQPKT